MPPKRRKGEELEYLFFEGDGSSFDEQGDYGVAGDDYKIPPVVLNSKIPEAMFPLRKEYYDVFHDELPDALPPLCDIQHHIDLAPSSQLPSRPHYRLCLEEHEELRRQVEEFVSKGHICKIMSTCAQRRGPLDLMCFHVSGSVPKKVHDLLKGCLIMVIHLMMIFLGIRGRILSTHEGIMKDQVLKNEHFLFLEAQDCVKEKA
nr:putative reverse transcriptase domain-containing protein [Tanacetum cinerariifolium]